MVLKQIANVNIDLLFPIQVNQIKDQGIVISNRANCDAISIEEIYLNTLEPTKDDLEKVKPNLDCSYKDVRQLSCEQFVAWLCYQRGFSMDDLQPLIGNIA